MPGAADAGGRLVCLGAGAGLVRGDVRDVRGSDVACLSGGVVVTADSDSDSDSGYAHRDPDVLGDPAAHRRRPAHPGPPPARPRT